MRAPFLAMLFASFAASVLLAAPAFADGLRIKPGQWQRDTSVTTTLAVAGEVTTLPVDTSVAGECLSSAEAVVDPADLVQEGCSLSDVTTQDRVLSFALACDTAGVTMDGTMKITANADGSQLDGAIALSGAHENGVAMTSNVIIRSRWIGDCAAGN
ncbi:MAG: DUF3617 family protein [Pseudomonadota bacterium]